MTVSSSPKGTLTLRINKDVLKKLNEQAKKDDLTVSALANKIFKNYVEWYSMFEGARLMVLKKDIFREIMNRLEDREIESIADYSVDKIKETTLYVTGKNELNSFLNYAELWLKMNNFNYRVLKDDDHADAVRYVIEHNMGKKVSLLMAKAFEHSVMRAGGKISAEKVGDNMLSLTIR